MTLQESIGAFLREDCPLIAAEAGARIYWTRPPEQPTFPLIVFRSAGERDMARGIDQRSQLIALQIVLACFSRISQSAAVATASAVEDSLVDWTGRTPTTDGEWTVQRIQKTNQEDIASDAYIEAGVYGVSQSFEVIAKPFTV